MIKITFKDKPGVIWFPITDTYDYKKHDWLNLDLDNTLNEIHKNIGMIVSNAGSNYIVANYDENTFKGLPDGEYVLTSRIARKLGPDRWLLHLGPYYTQPPMQNIKTVKKDNKEIKSFV